MGAGAAPLTSKQHKTCRPKARRACRIGRQAQRCDAFRFAQASLGLSRIACRSNIDSRQSSGNRQGKERAVAPKACLTAHQPDDQNARGGRERASHAQWPSGIPSVARSSFRARLGVSAHNDPSMTRTSPAPRQDRASRRRRLLALWRRLGPGQRLASRELRRGHRRVDRSALLLLWAIVAGHLRRLRGFGGRRRRRLRARLSGVTASPIEILEELGIGAQQQAGIAPA